MTCFAAKHSKFGVGHCFRLVTRQNILCKNSYTLRIISEGKGAVSEREIRLKVEKNEI